MLVVSYNPGYQNILKALKPSTRQRFVAIEFDFPPAEAETAVVAAESGLPRDRCVPLVRLADALRGAEGPGPGGRRLDPPAGLLRDPDRAPACSRPRTPFCAAMIEPLTDDPDVKAGAARRRPRRARLRRHARFPGTGGNRWPRLAPAGRRHRELSRFIRSRPWRLAEVQGQLAVMFRAFGGEAGVQIAGAKSRKSGHRLGWRQRIGLGEESLDHPGRDAATVFLPDRIDLFPIVSSTPRSIAGSPRGSRRCRATRRRDRSAPARSPRPCVRARETVAECCAIPRPGPIPTSG